MCKKFFTGFFLLFALAFAILSSMWPHEWMHQIINVTRFFELMLPVLAVGALAKYLCCWHSSCCDKKDS